MVESVVKSTKEAIEEADALIYVTSRLPNIQQIKVREQCTLLPSLTNE
jgi:hypothetical protein